MTKVLFVCHGNICRSTMAESVFTYMVEKAGLSAQFKIDSAATSTEEIGNPPHYGTVSKSEREMRNRIVLLQFQARTMKSERQKLRRLYMNL